MAAPIRKRRFPIVGDGAGIWSFIHVDDAAAATAVAVERGQPGVYNVVDDEPAPVREWLPVLASTLEAKPPRRVPRWLGRLLAGEPATVKAKRELGWKPRYASWRQGFAEGLGYVGAAPGGVQARSNSRASSGRSQHAATRPSRKR